MLITRRSMISGKANTLDVACTEEQLAMVAGGRENPGRHAKCSTAAAGVFDDRHAAAGMDSNVWPAAVCRGGASSQAGQGVGSVGKEAPGWRFLLSIRGSLNRLKGTDGDEVNAVLAAAVYNFRKLLKGFALLLCLLLDALQIIPCAIAKTA